MLDLARRASVRLGLLVVLTVVLATACLPLNSQESYVYDQTNALRSHHRVAHLAPHDALTTRAREWAAHLARRGQLAHSDLRQVGTSWSAAAENVGRSHSIEDVFRLLRESSVHRRNMLDGTYTHTGVGTARGGDGRVYVVQLFIRP